MIDKTAWESMKYLGAGSRSKIKGDDTTQQITL